MKQKSVRYSVILSILLAGTTVFAEQAPESQLTLEDRRFTMSLGAAFLRYNTQFKFIDKESGRSAFVDTEGNLNLPETATSPYLFGRYRFSPKHAISFGGFGTRRESSLIDTNFDIGDFTIDGSVVFEDTSNFWALNYTYTFMEDERARLFGSLGLYGLDVKYKLNAVGSILFNGVPIDSGTLERTSSVFAPLPLIGLDAVFALTPKWSFGAKVALVGGSVGDVRNAFVLDTNIRAQYMFNKNWGVMMGIKYFNAQFDINKSALKTEVSYGYDGAFLGLAVSF